MTNAFVAALLKMAAEHRLKAESARNMITDTHSLGPAWWKAITQHMNAELERAASEQDDLAEVYERYAHRIISEVADQLILEQFEQMFGEAALPDREFPPMYTMDSWYPGRLGMPLPPITPLIDTN